MAKPISKIENHLAGKQNDEARALGYYQRLNMAGMDYKGQISTAYSELGFGGSVSLGMDLNAMLPPFVHVKLSASGSVDAPTHAVVALQRHPTHIWREQVTLPEPTKGFKDFAIKGAGNVDVSVDGPLSQLVGTKRPGWSTATPLSFCHMKGRTKRFKGEVAAKAWAGLTENYATDETGVSIGAGAGVECEFVTTRLSDHEVCHFGPSAYSSKLADHVDDVMVQNLRTKVALWLAAVKNGPKAAINLGAETSTAYLLDEHASAVDFVVGQAEGQTRSQVISKLRENAKLVGDTDFNEANPMAVPSGWFGTVLRGLAHGVEELIRAIKRKKLDPAKLKTDVIATKRQYWQIANKMQHYRIRPPEEAEIKAFYTPERILEMRATAKHRIAQANDLLAAMKRIKGFEDNLTKSATPTAGQTEAEPLCFLNIGSAQGKV